VSLHLAIDTATARASLAVGTPRGVATLRVIEGRRDLSRAIERVSAELLEAADARARDLAGVVVADGPGSFTGLRIGVAFAKGVCRALGVPLLAVPSLMGAARAALEGAGTVLAHYDALRGEAYRALYAFAADGSVTVLEPPAIVASAALAAPPGSHLASEREASAAALLKLVGVLGGALALDDPSTWVPAYGRPAEAEARLRERQSREPGA
jgi:tRNA threonylcarbamoyladenosine biosynthesis protein TsaB